MLLKKSFSVCLHKTYDGTLKNEMFYINDFMPSVEFAVNLVFNGPCYISGALMIFCGNAISIEKREKKYMYIVFDPHSRCQSGMIAGSRACHVSNSGHVGQW